MSEATSRILHSLRPAYRCTDAGSGYRKASVDNCQVLVYTKKMIRSFRDKALERFFATGDGRRLSVQNTKRIANILRALDDASRPEDMNLPGFRFHALVGRDKSRYAVSASGNWRITFGWIDGDAIEVDLEDYH
jgi:toxin HigB-1